MDETSSLLRHTDGQIYHDAETSLVDFDPKGDGENPLDWSKGYKLGVVSLLSLMAFTTTFTCIGVVPIAERIVMDLDGRESKSASILLVTVWELGEAAGPLLIAPISEIYGRYPVYNIANSIFILGVVLAAVAPTANIFILARFLTGLAVAANVLNPAIIGDIYPSESRGSGMSLLMLAPLVGGAIGPAIAGLIAESLGWRNILWMSACLALVCEISFFVLLRETYKVTILQRRAARLRLENKDETLKCAWEEEKGWAELRTAITRPVTVLLDSVVLQLIAFFGCFIFSFYYILATTLPSILRDTYGFTPALTGTSFLSFSIGATCGIVACNLFLDSIYVKLGKSHSGAMNAEFRLPFAIIGSACFPAVVAFYGWVPSAGWPVYLLLTAVGMLGFIMIMVMVPVTSYVVDAFGVYSASAMTMVLIARCLGGTLIPLMIPPLTDAVGLGYGFLIMAAGCLVLVPCPIVILRYGTAWRQKSIYTRDN